MTTDDIMRLAEECEEWAEGYSASQSRYSSADAENVIALRDKLREARTVLRDAIDAMRKDAKRYRWLRDEASSGDWERIGQTTTPDTTDARVDACMACMALDSAN